MSDEEQAKTRPRTDLFQLAVRYFKKEGFRVEQDSTALEGSSGMTRTFDLIVQKARSAQGVCIRDWNRTIGVNVIINVDKASEDVGLASPIIIGDKFSDHAKSYANRRKITLLTKRNVTLNLR